MNKTVLVIIQKWFKLVTDCYSIQKKMQVLKMYMNWIQMLKFVSKYVQISIEDATLRIWLSVQVFLRHL